MKFTRLMVLLIVIAFAANAQTGKKDHRMATLGRVWGFLKYYHSSALKGKPDWDQELVRMIPLIEKAKDAKEFEGLMDSWYKSLPAAKTSNTIVTRKTDSTISVFDEKDIQQFRVTKWLKNELAQLYQYHIADTSRYVTRYYNHHLFDHIIHTEDAHEKPSYPSREMRLLALFRYWNTIEYFYPHKANIANWEKVLVNYIPTFLQAGDSIEYRNAIRALIHELPDSHSFMQVPGEVNYFTPFRIDFIEGKYVIGQVDPLVASTYDNKLGDEVIAINNKPVANKVKELLKTTTGTNELSLRRNIAQNLLKEKDSVVTVTFLRDGKRVSKQVTLHTWSGYSQLKRSPAQPLWREMEPGTWYVRFCRISRADTLKKLFSDISNAKAVIWDMRDYPNYNVVIEMYKYFFASKTAFTEERNASDFYPGMFIKSPYYFIPENNKPKEEFTGKLLVLVDEQTQSLSESVAAALRLRPNTIIMGKQTAGTTGNITWISLPGGIDVSYTGVGVVGTNNSFKQGDGVRIDVPVKVTIDKLKRYSDVIMNEAVLFLLP